MNVNAFKSQLALKGLTLNELAKKIGISRSAMYRKLNGKSEFTRQEIIDIMAAFGADDPTEIFFKDKVS